MIPLDDDNIQRRTPPYLTYLIIGINIAVFLYEISLPEAQLNNFFLKWAVVPADITHGQNLITLITSQFLHGGFLHIASNMLYLWVFGDNIEEALGKIGYLLFYIGTGIVAGLSQTFIDPNSTTPSLGASGAIAGVLGAYLVLFPRARVNTLIILGIIFFMTRISAIFLIGFWAVTQFFNGYTSLTSVTAQTGGGGVAYFAHIGGFVIGVIIALMLKPALHLPPPQMTSGRSYR